MGHEVTDTEIRHWKHSGKSSGDKHFIGGGLFLLVKATGKFWRVKYHLNGKEKTLSIGAYPAVPLAKARKARDEAKELLAQHIDPSTAKQQAKAARAATAVNTFEAVVREFHATKADGWSAVYANRWMRDMEKYLFPYIGKMPLAQITASVLSPVLTRVQERTIETAHNLRQSAGQVFRYGIQTDRPAIVYIAGW
jgi:hypothetical protein